MSSSIAQVFSLAVPTKFVLRYRAANKKWRALFLGAYGNQTFKHFS